MDEIVDSLQSFVKVACNDIFDDDEFELALFSIVLELRQSFQTIGLGLRSNGSSNSPSSFEGSVGYPGSYETTDTSDENFARVGSVDSLSHSEELRLDEVGSDGEKIF